MWAWEKSHQNAQIRDSTVGTRRKTERSENEIDWNENLILIILLLQWHCIYDVRLNCVLCSIRYYEYLSTDVCNFKNCTYTEKNGVCIILNILFFKNSLIWFFKKNLVFQNNFRLMAFSAFLPIKNYYLLTLINEFFYEEASDITNWH